VCSTAFDARLSSKLTYGDVHEVIGPAMIGYELRQMYIERYGIRFRR
jgi:hypothetical protein